LPNRENDQTASTLAGSEVETRSSPVCNPAPPVSPVHLSDRSSCNRIPGVSADQKQGQQLDMLLSAETGPPVRFAPHTAVAVSGFHVTSLIVGI